MPEVNIAVIKSGKGAAVPYDDDKPLTPNEARDMARRLVTVANAIDEVVAREKPAIRAPKESADA